MQFNPEIWLKPLWFSLLVAASVAFTFGFACAAPFAAFAAATACTLPRRDAFYLIGGVWLANQMIGFLFLNYPWDVNTFVWGAALGITALLSTGAARFVAIRLSGISRIAACFMAAFVAYEAALYMFSLLLGGTENFTFAIQGRVFAINALALALLFVANRIGISLGLISYVPRHA